MRALFDELIREGLQAGAEHEKIATRYLELILLKARAAASAGRTKYPGSSHTYEQVRRYIDENYKRLSSLDDLGQLSGVQPNYICRLFKKYDTETPIQSITRQKLNHAAKQLATTEMKVSEISEELGFADAFYFSRLFKKHYGVSPSQFRHDGES